MAGENFPANWYQPSQGIPMPESSGPSVFADAINGNDATGDGSIGNPYKTIQGAQQKAGFAAGYIIELRNHQGQVYRPPPGVRTINGVKFTENQGIAGQMTFVQFVSGGSLTVTVNGHFIVIQYVSGTSTRQNVTDAVNASAANTFLVASTTTGGTVLTGVDVVMSPIFSDANYTNGSNQTQAISSNSFWVAGSNGATPPGTCNPVTIRCYPPDRAAYGRVVVQSRGTGSGTSQSMNCPGKNLAAADQGKTAATIISQGTITVISGGGASYTSTGVVTIPGLTGSWYYTGKSGDTLTGLTAGGGAPTGTTTSGVVLPGQLPATDMNDLNTQGLSSLRLQGLKINYSSGRRGSGNYISGASQYIDVVDCEHTLNWYQNLTMDATPAHVYIRRCWNHDVGTGPESFPSDSSTNPDAQQHDCYLEGNDVWIICCVLADTPYGFSAQHFPSGDTHYNIHCTMATAGKGDPLRNAGNIVDDGVTNCKIINTIMYDPLGYNIKRGPGSVTGAIVSHSYLALNGAVVVNSHDYFGGSSGQSDSSWITDTANGKTTGSPPFVNYAQRQTDPNNLALVSDPGVVQDTTYSPAYDYNNKQRTQYTIGAFEQSQSSQRLRRRGLQRGSRLGYKFGLYPR